VVAICGRNRERAQKMADKYGISQVFTDYRQMIEAGTCDAIVVSTPDDTHYEMTMAALDTGLHVLCEKPVALNADHAREMYETADASGVKHMVLYTWHWLPPLQHIKQLVDGGYIGKPYHGNFHWLAQYAIDGSYKWRFDADRANGILGDLGSHLIHLAQWLLGDVTSISACTGYHVTRQSTNGRPANPANDTFLGTLEFASGAHIQLHVSGVAHVTDSEMKAHFALHGENGVLEAEWIPAEPANIDIQVRGLQDGTDERLNDVTQLNLLDYFKSNSIGPRLFVDSILDDKAIETGFYEGYKVQQVIDAALRSHQTGQRVTISQ
jgi:predicted dehydrogenase